MFEYNSLKGSDQIHVFILVFIGFGGRPVFGVGGGAAGKFMLEDKLPPEVARLPWDVPSAPDTSCDFVSLLRAFSNSCC
jgi:hypothetical protein